MLETLYEIRAIDNIPKEIMKMTDTRLVGMTAENIFLSLLNEKGVFSHVLTLLALMV
jgi:hypothetical protein